VLPTTVRYGDHPDQVADVHLPDGRGNGRVVVSVHGGFFRPRYGRDFHDRANAALVAAGFAVVNAEYRRTGAPGTPTATTADVEAVVGVAADLAAAPPEGRVLRPGLAVVGHSVGGYLALWCASRPEVDLAVALCPLTDVVGAAETGVGGTAVPDWVGGGPAELPATYAALDLAERLPTRTPTLLVHGAADEVVPADQSEWYAERARAAGDPCELRLLDGEGHYGVLEPGTPAYACWADVLATWAEG
jgi:acetyl esterase/lipase